MLTNDPFTWDNESSGANYDPFKLSDGRTVSGQLAWPETASLRASQDRFLELAGEYMFDWQDYTYQHPPHASGKTAFKYCLTTVTPPAAQ